MPDELTLDDVRAARERIAGVAIVTPMLPSPSVSHLAGRDVWLKAENLQRTGSFKLRGATNALALFGEEERRRGVVAASAGNHAQGVALAARELEIPATVFMPTTAAIPKIAATRGYEAEVILAGSDLGESVDAALSFSAETGARFLHPYDDPAVVAGQGTVGLEIIEQLGEPATVVIPVGGGGLIGGTAMAVRSLVPGARIVGVHAQAVPTYIASREAGRPMTVDVAATVADGIAVGRPSDLAFELIETHVDDLVTVSDAAATRSVALLLERSKLLVEPSGAVAVAAVADGLIDARGPIVCVLSGGNIDLLLLDSLVRHGLESEGRFASLDVTIPDRPGELAAVLAIVGDLGANVLDADHHREGRGLEYGMVEIRLSIETRSHDHRERILQVLRDRGIEVGER